MLSALDLGCSNHNPTQATSGNPIATSECWDYWVNGQLLDNNGLSELSSHRFWLFMVSALDLGCSNHNPTHATSGNPIATSHKRPVTEKVESLKSFLKYPTFWPKWNWQKVAIRLPVVAWVGLWLELPRSSAETLRRQNLWLERLKSSSSSSFHIAYFLNIRT